MTTKPRDGQRRPGGRAAPVILVAALACAAAVAAATPRIEALWASEAPLIDGVLTEWTSLERLDQAKMSVAMRNDGRFLYAALASSDPSTRMLLGTAGFTVWFDPAGKNKKAFGIAIPPAMASGPGMRGGGPGTSGGPPGSRGAEGQPPSEQGGPPPGPEGQEGRHPPEPEGRGGPGGLAAIGPLRAIEVAGPGKDDLRRLELAYARTIGIDVAVRLSEGVLVYEFRLPLAASPDQPHAVRAVPGAAVGLGIETNKLERGGRGDEGGRGRAGGPGGGGIGGIGGPGGGGIGGPGGGGIGGVGGGGMGGRSGGGMGGGMMGGAPPGGGRDGMEQPKPIKIWTVVRLAAPPA